MMRVCVRTLHPCSSNSYKPKAADTVTNAEQKSETIALLVDLVQRPSVTPADHGCQKLIADRLRALGFHIEHIAHNGVDNLWARYGDAEPLLVFAGHTDVVPTGDEEQWTHAPFAAEIHDGHLFGRGAADMKGSVAAMVTAMERFIQSGNMQQGSIALLLTSDEEGPAVDGTKRVVELLDSRNEVMDYCIVGEPTSQSKFGDTIKNGRRGSLSAALTVHGKQGHVAYPHLADNPVHKSFEFLNELVSIEWDKGDENFPPTTLQISNINAGTGAGNVIPGDMHVEFNLRYNPASGHEKIQLAVGKLIEKHALDTHIEWHHSAEPFITPTGSLTTAMQAAVSSVVNVDAELNTGGGTSDGRFIAKTCKQVIEFGPLNKTIHQTNECISCKDIDTLSVIYEKLIAGLLGRQETQA